uniref:Uncharacterized protein n=1 Tax=Trypanosoma congolense (strain IL3000) TaxID=1068625 RepID=G0UT98_TRYCI|nr:hypothetical protein, unlikely [Trypanosoma congolense IL3000]
MQQHRSHFLLQQQHQQKISTRRLCEVKGFSLAENAPSPLTHAQSHFKANKLWFHLIVLGTLRSCGAFTTVIDREALIDLKLFFIFKRNKRNDESVSYVTADAKEKGKKRDACRTSISNKPHGRDIHTASWALLL